MPRIRGQCAARNLAQVWRELLSVDALGTETLSGEGLDHDRADRVQVGLHGGRVARPPFRGQVAGRPQDDPGHRDVVVGQGSIHPKVEALGDAEVADLRVAVLLQQDVAGLDVPVQHPAPVGRGERSKGFRHDECDAFGR